MSLFLCWKNDTHRAGFLNKMRKYAGGESTADFLSSLFTPK